MGGKVLHGKHFRLHGLLQANMSSQFDMNQQSRICAICTEIHPIHNPCKYDRLVQIIHAQKQQMISLIKGNREVVQTAQEFQKIIRDIEPVLFRLFDVEKKYKELIGDTIGTTDVQTETSQLSLSEIQPETKDTEYVQPCMGEVPPSVPSIKP